MVEFNAEKDWRAIRKQLKLESEDHRLDADRMHAIHGALRDMYLEERTITPHHYDVAIQFLNRHFLAEMASFRGQPLTFQEEQLVRDLLLENWHSQTGHQNKRVEALELLVRGGPAAESLFANFMETLKSLDREDKDFKKRVPGGRAQGSVGHDLFSNPLQYLLFPVDYGPYAGIHDADTLRGYLAYLKTHPI